VYQTRFLGTARALEREHGNRSAAVAAERAEELMNNIDLGGFAFWKRVERCIQSRHSAA